MCYWLYRIVIYRTTVKVMPQFLVISTSTIVAYSDFSVNFYYYFLSKAGLLFQPNHQYLNSASLYIMQHNVYHCQLIHASCLVFVLLASSNLFVATSMKTKLRRSNLYPHQLCACWLINPRRACAARVTVLGLCVCVCVCYPTSHFLRV